MIRRSAALLFILLAAFILPGCWDRTEINDMAFILTSGIDLEDDGKYRISVMVPLPGQMGGASGGGGGTSGDKSYYVDSEVGETYRECLNQLQKRMSRRMFLAHRRTIIVGEALAKRGLQDLYDSTPRSPENRMTTYLIVAKGKASDMLMSTPRFERFPSEAVRELVKARGVIDINFKDFGVALSLPGADPVAVYMAVKESEKSEKPSKEVEFKGYAQFRNDKMIGSLENDEAIGLSLLHGQKMIINMITVQAEDGSKMSVRIYSSSTNIRTTLIDQQVHFNINIQLTATMMEDKTKYDLSQTDNVLKVEAAISEYAKNTIQKTIDSSIQHNVDSTQLGSTLWRAYPEQWASQFEKNWPEGLKDAKLDIQVESQLTDTGLIYDNITKEHAPK
ncbi:Ger(x)C family spore germination protein [Paenibacillus agricola]|uniref:Ger(X)C family spore germination protein n=1 Tax=Paenibacillus agricola TaxID=2716264 RepID=A0ABX0J9R5_9BACL|nr:Ger(x)C family spore germination protein [Paenibacillus agricola]NHN31954.1 Ger(x)C family spore germination protein [Paenibacillus agricola]